MTEATFGQNRNIPGEHHIETVPVIAETARVEKRLVETDRVVINKTVSERDEVIDALLARNDVSVERVKVGRVVAEPPAPRQDGDIWVFPILEEQLVVEKRLVLVEELHIRTTTSHENTQQIVRLRTEHVSIERDPAAGRPLPADTTPQGEA